MHALLNKINEALTPEEQKKLKEITAGGALAAHVLPIRSVGVQVRYIYSLLFFNEVCVLKLRLFGYFFGRVIADLTATFVPCPRTRNPIGTPSSSWLKLSPGFAKILTGQFHFLHRYRH